MKAAALIVAAALAGCMVPGTLPQVPSVLLVQCMDGGTASATAITPEWLLTCKHALPIVAVGGQPVVQVVEFPDAAIDLVLVKVATPRAWRCAKLATAAPAFGDHLRATGYHAGRYLLVTDGRQGADPRFMSCDIMLGASGGSVVNNSGELVGIVSQVAVYNGQLIFHAGWMVPVVGLRTWILDVTR